MFFLKDVPEEQQLNVVVFLLSQAVNAGLNNLLVTLRLSDVPLAFAHDIANDFYGSPLPHAMVKAIYDFVSWGIDAGHFSLENEVTE